MVSQSNAYNSYRRQTAETASPGDLVVMLYNGCIKDLDIERSSIEKKDYENANKYSQKAQSIIAELMGTLNMKYPISTELWKLYDFILDMIVQSNVKKDVEKIDIAVEMLTDLRDTWAQAVKINRRQVFADSGIDGISC